MILIPSLYILEKKSPCQQISETNVLQKKQIATKNGQTFASKVFHFQYDKRAGEVDFKVEGLWNTEKYISYRRSRMTKPVTF